MAKSLTRTALWPVAVAQGLWLRNTIPRLPEASGRNRGTEGIGRPFVHLAVYGESPVAGVGVADHRDGLGPAIGARLAHRLGCQVHWRVVGRNGLKSCQLPALVSQDLAAEPSPEFAVICMGVNDSKGLTRPDQWIKNLTEVRARLASEKLRRVLYSGVPKLDQFPALPRPLSTLLAERAMNLELALQTNLAAHERLLPFNLDFEPDLFASDGFHPSAEGFHRWGMAIADGIIDL